jgi:type II secretory pathway pseudopilin PulG
MRDARLKLNERGFTLAGALTILAILAIFWALTLPLWARIKQRDKEEELIFRGNEYIEAIGRYHQKYGTYPPDLETLQKMKFIRKLYVDPMTKSGKWKVLHPDSLVQTGAAGHINMPGGLDDKDKDKDKKFGKKNKLGAKSDDDEDDDDDEDMSDNDSNSNDPFGLKDEDKDKAEEKEVESVGPVVGVVSRSKKESIKIYNGQDKYNKWKFVYMLPQQRPGQVAPGLPPGGVGTPGTNQGPGQKSPGGPGTMGGQKNPPTPKPPSPPNSGSNDDDDND